MITTKKNIATKIIATFVAPLLTRDNFVFDSKCYLQIKGCDMEFICALPLRIYYVRIRGEVHMSSNQKQILSSSYVT